MRTERAVRGAAFRSPEVSPRRQSKPDIPSLELPERRQNRFAMDHLRMPRAGRLLAPLARVAVGPTPVTTGQGLERPREAKDRLLGRSSSSDYRTHAEHAPVDSPEGRTPGRRR